MAMNVLKTIDDAVLRFFDINLSPTTRRSVSALIAGMFITLGVCALWWGYSAYSVHREKNAQKDLASCIEQYEKAVAAGSTSVMWPLVEASCKTGYDRNARSGLAPYFLSYQAEALIKQNKIDEAVAVMKNMVSALSKNSPLYNLYAMKYALMQMDSTDSTVRAAGLQDLARLAADSNNAQRDEALYYLGLYNWHINDTAQAKAAWQQLMDMSTGNNDQVSPWTSLVAERLKLIA